MNALDGINFIFLLLLTAMVSHAFPTPISATQQIAASPTPFYDPFAEPPLPPSPTDFELGRNLYWHWCMPCHGDRGQGLTDEFRGMWEADHQNCWGRGCHAGRPGDFGFSIPTYIPPVVNNNHLARFSNLEELTTYLQKTHPPQSPGSLKIEEYQAIALFVFTTNGRVLTISSPVADFTPTLNSTPLPKGAMNSTSTKNCAAVFLSVTMLALSLFLFRYRKLRE